MARDLQYLTVRLKKKGERGDESMKKEMLKKGVVSLALAGSFIVGVGAFDSANAQDPRWNRQGRIEQPRRNGNNGPIESTGNIDRNKNGIDDRYEVNGQVDINQNRIPDSQEHNGRFGRDRDYYGNNGNYGNRGYNSFDFQQGYRAGLSRGREDALANRGMIFNNSNYYRSGNAAYRAGFERGCNEAYQQYRNRRW